MDTGDLSEEAYLALIVEAERFNHDSTLQFGLLSYRCKNEDDFLKESIKLIYKMKKYDEIDIDDMFFGNPLGKDQFHEALDRILINIENVMKIQIGEKTYD